MITNIVTITSMARSLQCHSQDSDHRHESMPRRGCWDTSISKVHRMGTHQGGELTGEGCNSKVRRSIFHCGCTCDGGVGVAVGRLLLRLLLFSLQVVSVHPVCFCFFLLFFLYSFLCFSFSNCIRCLHVLVIVGTSPSTAAHDLRWASLVNGLCVIIIGPMIHLSHIHESSDRSICTGFVWSSLILYIQHHIYYGLGLFVCKSEQSSLVSRL